MAADPNPALRAELVAARGVLEEQIVGLDALEDIGATSPALHQHLADKFASHIRRRELIDQVLVRLDEAVAALGLLEADGYPDALESFLNIELYRELAGKISAIETAFALFLRELSGATRIDLDLAHVTSVSQPVPTETDA